MEYSFGIPLKKPVLQEQEAVDQTDKEAEYYRKMVIQLSNEIELLKHQLKEETEARYAAYARIKELTEKD